jgi:hypothetical protein
MAAIRPRAAPSLPPSQPIHGYVIPGGKFLKSLLSVLVAFPGSGLREGALGGPDNGGRSGCRGSRAHSADLRRGAHEGHLACQLAGGKLQRYFGEWVILGSWAVLLCSAVLVVRSSVRFRKRMIQLALEPPSTHGKVGPKPEDMASQLTFTRLVDLRHIILSLCTSLRSVTMSADNPCCLTQEFLFTESRPSLCEYPVKTLSSIQTTKRR